MKKFLSFLGSESANNSAKEVPSPAPANPPTNLVTNLKNRLTRTNRNPVPAAPDAIPIIISNAATALADSVQEIVSDTSNLKGDSISGYQTLLDILDDHSASDAFEDSSDRGIGSIGILLQYLDHPRFVELCSQANLVTVLFQALRLLRMMEIKQSKGADTTLMDKTGVTFNATCNVCKIMERLFSQSSSIEQVRQSLVKILTFPIGIFPCKGVHIQMLSAGIVSAMCRTGFTSQQIWFLHDVQAMSHMLKQLSELVAVPNDTRGDVTDTNDFLLRGLAAEREGMWITVIRCIVDVVNAGGSTSSVLMNDFEIANGSKIFLQILRTCSSQFFLQTLNTMMTMFTGSTKKAEDMLSFTCIPSILSEFIVSVLCIPRGLTSKDTAEELIDMCHMVVDASQGHFTREYIVQAMSYSLLTLYSNDPANCTSLEANYCFLPSLIITIPTLAHAETITAVLTSANYVCQCADYISESTLRALCAACAVAVLRGMDRQLDTASRQLANLQIELLFSSVDAISRSSISATDIVLRNGLLRHIINEPFEKLCKDVVCEFEIDALTFGIFQRIVDLIIVLNLKSNKAADEIRKTGLGLQLRRIVGSPRVSPEFLGTLLRLNVEFARVDNTHLQESLISIMTLIREIQESWDKQVILFDSLWRILIDSDGSASMQAREGGFSCAFHLLDKLKNAFAQTDVRSAVMAKAIESVVRFLSLLLFLANDDSIESEFAATFARKLVETKILSSLFRDNAIATMFQFITIFAAQADYMHGPAVDVFSEVLSLIPDDLVVLFLEYLERYLADNMVFHRQLMVEAGVVDRLLRTLSENKIIKNDSSMQVVKRFVSLLSQKSLTLESGLAIFRYLIRPGLRGSWQDLSLDESNDVSSRAVCEAFDLYLDSKTDSAVSVFGEIPHFALNVGGWSDPSQSSSLTVLFGESTTMFPSTESSISMWFKVGEGRSEESVVIIPLMHFESSESTDSVAIEYNLETNEVIVTSSQNGVVKEEPAKFKPSLGCVRTTDWTHMVVSFKRNKRFGAATTVSPTIFVDGMQWTPMNANSLVTECFSSNNASGELRIGYANLTGDNISAKVNSVFLHIGTILIYSSFLNARQVAMLFLQGPLYLSLHPEDLRNEEDTGLLARQSLRVAAQVSKNALRYLEKAGLKGLESFVEPRLDTHRDLVVAFDGPTMDTPQVVINALASRQAAPSFSTAKAADGGADSVRLCTKTHNIFNVIDLEASNVVSTLSSSGHIDRFLSFGTFVASLGGPDALLPLLAGARDEASVCSALRLILFATRQSVYNSTHLQQQAALHAIAFVLHRLPRAAITAKTVEVLASFVAERPVDVPKSGQDAESTLVVDTAAALALLFNDRVLNSLNHNVVLSILKNIKVAVKDEKYGPVNAMKLSAIGTARWLVMLALHIVEKSNSLKFQAARSRPADAWTYRPKTAFEVADFRDESEEFFSTATVCLQYIVGSELRGKDLDWIASTILFTFAVEGESPLSPARESLENEDEQPAHSGLPFCTYTAATGLQRSVRRLSALEYFRVYLFRLLMTLFEDSQDESRRTPDARRTSMNAGKNAQSLAQSNLQLFRQRCSPAWILSCLERSSEVATMSHALRLLGMFIQRDEEYSREFAEIKGYQVLCHLLCSKTQEIPVVLPLIGLLFGVPMQMVLQPSQIKSVLQFSRLLDLEECTGPHTKSPLLEEKSLPLLHIYYECLVNAERSGATKVVDLLGGALLYAFTYNASFRELMQHKVAVEVHVTAWLCCSNAFAEFGSKIFADQNAVDLTAAIRDDYIRLSGTMKGNPFDEEYRDLQNYQESTDRAALELTHGLGAHLQESCKSMISFGLQCDQESAKVLYNLFISYNLGVFSPQFEHDFQCTVVELFEFAALQSLENSNNDLKVFVNIARNLSSAIPLAKACYLYDVANLRLLRLNLSHLRRLSELMLNNRFLTRAKHDDLKQAVQDLGNNARYLSFLCLHTGVYSYLRGGTLHRLQVLQLVRENLDILFQEFLEDSNDVFVVAAGRFLGRGSVDDRSLPSTQMFEALQGLTSGGGPAAATASLRKSVSTTNQVRQDRNRFAAYFAVFLVNYVFPLVLDDTPAVRTESIRIISFLSCKRRALLEPVVSGLPAQSKSSRQESPAESEFNVFSHGFLKLVPNAKGEYELTLRGGADTEESRFMDFSFWVSEHGAQCDAVFRGVEATMTGLFPHFDSEIDELNRVRGLLPAVRDLWYLDNAEHSRVESERREIGQRLAEKVARFLVSWRNDSVRGLTVGALHWKQVWMRLRSSPVWGYHTQDEPCIDRQFAARTKINWRVDYFEGPEKTRRKLIQDVSPYNAVLYGESSVDKPSSAAAQTLNSQRSQQNELENLLKQMNKRGILRKASSADLDADLSADLDMEELSPMQLDADETAAPPPNEDEGDADEAVARSREDSMADLDLLDSLEERGDEPPPRMVSVESKKLARSLLLREVIKGIVPVHDLKNCSVYNVERIVGLETQKALLFLSPHGIHILCGIVAQDANAKLVDMVFEWTPSNIASPALDAKSLDELSDHDWLRLVWNDMFEAESAHFRFLTEEIYSFFKRKHQLKFCALEIADTKGMSVLFSCESIAKCNEILAALLERDLPSSIFNKMVGLKNIQLLRGATNVYHKLIAYFLSSLTVLWQQGQITNFEYLMHVNSAAGRSFLDLTQYPVFPWILSDYSSETLDLRDPAIYRDLSKPMGALGGKRASQYLDRYQTMDEFFREGVEGSSPPFHYGTHYSCAGYVLHYLLRLQPYANMSLVLQGGSFDKADRLFSSIEGSWSSASQENLQDVRELIPEFFYLPDFLVNMNGFDLGVTQREETVNHVQLPNWARNDPKEFVRIHRQALESKYVSENLHHWIDLVFGYKQRGKASIDAMNVFINLTYEGEVDIDAIDDPIFRAATLSQINNFGQTPSKIFHKNHPRKFIPEVVRKSNDMVLVEPTAISWHSHLSPPLCVVGAPQFSILNKISFAPAPFYNGPSKTTVGDVRLLYRDRAIACPAGSVLLPPLYRKIVKYRSLLDGIMIQTLHTNAAARALEGEKELTHHEQMHVLPITCVACCNHGEFLATGSEDMSVRIWRVIKMHHSDRKISEVCVFSGHEDMITCLDMCTEFGVVVSGSRDRSVCVWDYRHRVMVRMLSKHSSAVLSVSINPIDGSIVTLTKEQLRVYHINGDLISTCNFLESDLPMGKVAIAVPTAEWQDGVVAVSGHKGGHIFLWKLQDSRSAIYKRELAVACRPDKCHTADITVLHLCPSNGAVQKPKNWIRKAHEDSRHLDLVAGDADGNMSRWTTARLDQLNQLDLYSLM